MNRSTSVLVFLLAAVAFLAATHPAIAAITWSGNVSPSDPTTWTDSNSITIGVKSLGTLEISDDSDLITAACKIGSYSTATGYVSINGTGSTWTSGGINVGYSGEGSLAITDGASVKSRGSSNIGYYPNSTGTVSVDGSGSTWTNSWDLQVGAIGSGTLLITNGGTVSNDDCYVGFSFSSISAVTVDGANSQWSARGEMVVGYYGNGTLTIANGGTVNNTHTCIGQYSSATGSLIVDGVKSTLNIDRSGSLQRDNGVLRVGHAGNGTLSITNGGTVNVSGKTYVTNKADHFGWIDFGTDGGTLTTQSISASSSQLHGKGTINTNGIVSTFNLVFDKIHGLKQSFIMNDEPGQNITVNIDLDCSYGDLGVCNGSLTIQDGVTVSSHYGYIGYSSSSTGTATVSGIDSKWTNDAFLYIGHSGNGSLAITDGASVSNLDGYIGYNSGSRGQVVVDGPNSTWITGGLYVGYAGDGTLLITNSSNVSAAATFLVQETGSMGIIDFCEHGGTLTTGSFLYASESQLQGTGTINTKGLIGDVDLVFDSSHDLLQTFTFHDKPSQNITLNLDVSGEVGVLGTNNGSFTIQDGKSITSNYGYIGYSSGSNGTATVNGPSSKWTIRNEFSIGHCGHGTLAITDGGTVNNVFRSYLGYASESTGVVNVDDSGSTWTIDEHLYVGYSGEGLLTITGGSCVSNEIGVVGSEEGSTGQEVGTLSLS